MHKNLNGWQKNAAHEVGVLVFKSRCQRVKICVQHILYNLPFSFRNLQH